MNLQRMTRFLSILICLVLLAAAGMAETALEGEWTYRDNPGVTVLNLEEDGTAVYAGQDLTWADEGEDILLTDAEGAAFRMPYEADGDILTVWLPSLFTRISEIGSEGQILGTWKAVGTSESSYVFTEGGQFLEDGMFTGTYLDDPENGRVTLKYAQGMFEDTLILYSFDGDTLVIAYPWKLIRK